MKFFALVVAAVATSFAPAEAAATTGLRGPATTAGASVPTLPNGMACRFCLDDDNYKYPTDDDWWRGHWHRALDEATPDASPASEQRELTSTDKLKAAAHAAHYEAHYLQHAASKQDKEEHKLALKDAAAQAHEEAAILVDAVHHESLEEHDRILKEVKLPSGMACRFCLDDDNYKYPTDDDWWRGHWHRALDETTPDASPASDEKQRELTSTDKLKAASKAAHYEAHFLQHAAIKETKEEHKRALKDAAAKANEEASLLVNAVNDGDLEDHARILKEVKLPNGMACRFCLDDDNYKYPTDDDWWRGHWHRDLKAGDEAVAEAAAADADGEDRKLKEVKLPNGMACRFCLDDDNYKYPTDDDWWRGHWH